MEFERLIRERKSIRGYLDKAVPRNTIDEIIETAKWAPSSMNTQPWHVHVVTGAPLDRIRKGNSENMMIGQGIMQSNVVRKHAGIPDGQNIMICIAMGYPDDSFVANSVKSVREKNATFVRYVGFDETP